MKKVKLRPHHIEEIYKTNKRENYIKSFLKLIKRGYGPYFALSYVLLAKNIHNNSSLEVEITSSIDYFCKKCKKRKDHCYESDIPQSGIEIGKSYEWDELVKLIKN